MLPDDRRWLLLRLLDRYEPIDSADAHHAGELKRFVLSTPCCFDRSHLEGHVTGSAWVVNHAGTHVLLTHHRKLNKWLQLGGHADGDADVPAVARREAEEESGLRDLRPATDGIFDVDIHPIPARSAEPAHFHYDVRFAFRASDGAEAGTVIGPESLDLAWIALDQLETVTTEPSTLRMRAKWLKAPHFGGGRS